MSLFSREQLQEMYDRAHAQQTAELVRKHAAMTRTKTKAEILLEVAQEFAPCTVAELATAASMSQSWVRKHLKQAGIVLAKPVRQRKGVTG
jgi:hypothetical protein